MNDHVDMSDFIAARSDQLNADDLMDNPRTITITKVTASPDSAEQPVSIHYDGGEGRPFKPCKTVRRIMVSVWGKDASKYVGRSMTLYRDPAVSFGGMQVGGIRVSHMSHIDGDKTVALMVTRGRKAPFKVQPLKNAPTSPASPSTEDAAAKWANGFIAKLPTLDAAGLSVFEAEKAAKLAELEEKKPELHRMVTAALAARKAEFAPGSGNDGEFDDDLTTDTSAKTTDLSGEPEVDARIAELEAAPDLAAVEDLIKATNPHLTFLEERLQMKLEIAFSQARDRFGGVAEQVE
jgi:hypothetical protein